MRRAPTVIPRSNPKVAIANDSSMTILPTFPGLSPSASIMPNSRVRSNTDIRNVFNTLKATSTISTPYISHAVEKSACIACFNPGCRRSQSRTSRFSLSPTIFKTLFLITCVCWWFSPDITMEWAWLPILNKFWKVPRGIWIKYRSNSGIPLLKIPTTGNTAAAMEPSLPLPRNVNSSPTLNLRFLAITEPIIACSALNSSR